MFRLGYCLEALCGSRAIVGEKEILRCAQDERCASIRGSWMASFTAEAAATSKEPALQGNEGAGNPEGESKTAALPSRLRASLQCSG